MDQDAAAELLKQRLGESISARLAEQLLRRTDSDPTLLSEILDQVDPQSTGLQRVPVRWPSSAAGPVVAVLAGLEDQARQVIDVAAVIGREFDLAILERACSELDVLSGLEAAADLVRPLSGHVFSFHRALDREVCYDELGPRRRAELHEKVAAALTALGATSGARAATVVELAYHLGEAAALGGGDRLDAAAAAAATAAATADNEGVLDMAAEYFAQAATFAGRAGWAPGQAGRLMVAAGTARLRAAQTYAETQLGRASLTGALRMGMRAEDPGLIAAAALGFGPRPTLGPLAASKQHGDKRVPVDRLRLDALQAALQPLADQRLTLDDLLADPDQAIVRMDQSLEPSVAARLTARLALETRRADLALRANGLAHESGDPRALAEAALAVAELTGDELSLRHAEREAAVLADLELLARVFDLHDRPGLERLAGWELVSASAFVRWYVLRARAALAALNGDDASAMRAQALEAGQVVDREAARLADEVIADVPKPQSAASQQLSSLTAREREVLELALRGTPSREIADSLVVAERTVETHLASIYRKLGVGSRIELIMKFK